MGHVTTCPLFFIFFHIQRKKWLLQKLQQPLSMELWFSHSILLLSRRIFFNRLYVSPIRMHIVEKQETIFNAKTSLTAHYGREGCLTFRSFYR